MRTEDSADANRPPNSGADRRYAPRLRCPCCGGLVNLAAGVVDLTTGDRRAVCWECGTQVVWGDATLAILAADPSP